MHRVSWSLEPQRVSSCARLWKVLLQICRCYPTTKYHPGIGSFRSERRLEKKNGGLGRRPKQEEPRAMKLKSFFANSIEEAIRLARHELGPDAMLVNSMRAGVEARHLGFYEVVVCGEGNDTAPKDPARGPEPGTERGRTSSRVVPPLPADKLSQDISELKQRMEKLALTLARSGPGTASVAFDSERSLAFTTLTDAELDTDL